MRQAHKKKPSTGLSNFSVLEEGQDGWATPPKTSSNDELPLNSIQVQQDYERRIESRPDSGSAWVDQRKKSWYPGS